METILVVLWLFMVQPFVVGGQLLSPGWFSVATLDPASCARALARAPGPAICATPSVQPEPLARPLNGASGEEDRT